MSPAFQIARVLWEARLREGWGQHAEIMMARDPWPKHIADPHMGAAHSLAIAEAQALLKVADVRLKVDATQ